ncbi:MAG: MlaE family ABC transporter permease, partial [Candidatus Kapaibacteriota bacterium]
RWEDFPVLFLKNGVNALPIVSLILLLIGIISGYQGAIQLKQFGADIYIADLIGVSIVRELGPLMTAILVAGRSGSAFAAELGTMKVSEEIDALRSMGFEPFKFLILPRVFAVTLSIPLLTIFGNVAGILGGLISGLSILDITTAGYFTELQIAVDLGDLSSGLLKSIIFGYLVAGIGCFRGLQVKGGAEGVGTATTISVVSGIFAIIIADTIFTFIFDAIGL